MIKAKDAIETARSLLGTPYSTLDCINLVKKVIRTAPGGDPKFTCAHVPALWASGDDNVSAKYHYLTRRWENIACPQLGLLAFKGKPLGFDHQPSHIGIVAKKGSQWTVIHSSSVYGKVVETPLTTKEGWRLLAEIKFIKPGEEEEKEDIPVQEYLYEAFVDVDEGSTLNLRAKPATGSTKILAKLPEGDIVDVLEETNDKWAKVEVDGQVGYCYRKYLEKIVHPTDSITVVPAVEVGDYAIRIVDEAGNTFWPNGKFSVELVPLTDLND